MGPSSRRHRSVSSMTVRGGPDRQPVPGESGRASGLTLEHGPRFSVGAVTRTPIPGRGLRVAELAGAVGLSADTVRYYERVGLLPPPARTPAGYRLYDAGAVDRLRFVQGAQRLGLRLRDIAELLAVRDTGVCACEPAEHLLRRRLADLDAELARLAALRTQMAAMVEALPGQDCPPPTPGTWCAPDPGGADLPSPGRR